MIPKRSRRRVIPVLRFAEGGQLCLERHHYAVGVNDPRDPAEREKRPGASDKPSDNAPRLRQTQPDLARQGECPDLP